MPVYEFRCTSGDCPTYEVWREIDRRDVDTDCPVCSAPGQRIFQPPMTLSSGLRLKQERREPELVSRKNLEPRAEKPRLKESTARPWMVTRGC
ncbi:zinc ribbon domain-containing protein [Synechococcus sp. RSCCF101]|uniref:FmdB family zinc ribbon protein n=1 Tax=Synechococcus sp. RSCCF101 TaxID=2511069 RepID=UPI001244B3CE|nr:FmdB family zinc ribbon protein [Synechococcus sp. RSCCF101]QEY32644.1 zinc ribbon domain-containing protein [Synechococcus sp. RSCCF101]